MHKVKLKWGWVLKVRLLTLVVVQGRCWRVVVLAEARDEGTVEEKDHDSGAVETRESQGVYASSLEGEDPCWR